MTGQTGFQFQDWFQVFFSIFDLLRLAFLFIFKIYRIIEISPKFELFGIIASRCRFRGIRKKRMLTQQL